MNLQEVFEELDAQQRVKIESDRVFVDSLNKKIADMEKKITEKEYAVRFCTFDGTSFWMICFSLGHRTKEEERCFEGDMQRAERPA